VVFYIALRVDYLLFFLSLSAKMGMLYRKGKRMKAVQTVNPNLETVWAALQEIAKRQEEIDIQIKKINLKIEEITYQKN